MYNGYIQYAGRSTSHNANKQAANSREAFTQTNDLLGDYVVGAYICSDFVLMCVGSPCLN